MDAIRRLGINPDEIENCAEKCKDILNDLNIDSSFLEEGAIDYLDEISFSFSDITSTIMDAYVEATCTELLTKFDEMNIPRPEIEGYVNGYEIKISINGDSDTVAAFKNAIWEYYKEVPEVADIIKTCHSLMAEADIYDDESLLELEQYARNWVEADFDCDEYDASNVKEAFLHETAEWVEESCDGKVEITYNNDNLYINGKEYELGYEMLNIEIAVSENKSKDSKDVVENFIVNQEWVRENYHGEAELTIPDGAVAIDEGAFECCENLTSVNIPESVTEIGEYAFNGCYNLKSIHIPDGVTKIGNFAFSGCKNLVSVNIPDSVTKIGDNTFNGCNNLEIICSEGSYAEKFAILSNVPFEHDDSLQDSAKNLVSENINPIEELMSIKAKMEELQKTFQANMGEMQESLEKIQKKIKANKGTEHGE